MDNRSYNVTQFLYGLTFFGVVVGFVVAIAVHDLFVFPCTLLRNMARLQTR
jgi:hypothetical protein